MHLVVSAWGCGAFGLPPADVARMFREELRFSTLASVTFAIVEDHNTTGRHVLSMFKREFHGVVSASDIYPLPAVGFMFTVNP